MTDYFEERFRLILQGPLFVSATEVAGDMGYQAYVIGGFVRDVLLERPSNDIDIVVLGNGIDYAAALARKLGLKRKIDIFRNFGTAHFVFEGFQVEIVGARKESYREDSRKPIVENGSLEDDQNRRDFTINALAVGLNPENRGVLVDPFNGLTDLAKGIIRTPLNPDVTFSDDPLRMMRAIRFACQLGFGIHPEAYLSIKRNSYRIDIVSMERVTEELNKIILTAKPSAGFEMLFETGLLERIFPEFLTLKGVQVVEEKGHKDNFYHTLEVLDRLSANTGDLWLRWSAILHDIAKPLTKKYEPGIGWTFHGHDYKGSKMVPRIFARMKLPLNEKMRFVQKLVQLHLRPIVLSEDIVTDSAVRRLLFDAGDDIDDLMMLCEADITSKNQEKVKRYMLNFEVVRRKLKEIEEKDRLRNWQPPVTGEMIMKTFGIGPSREVGIIKNAIREAILDGIIPNEHEAAYEFMLREGENIGLKKNE